MQIFNGVTSASRIQNSGFRSQNRAKVHHSSLLLNHHRPLLIAYLTSLRALYSNNAPLKTTIFRLHRFMSSALLALRPTFLSHERH